METNYLEGFDSFIKGFDKAVKEKELEVSTTNKLSDSNPYMDGLITNPTVIRDTNNTKESLGTLESNEGFRDKIYRDTEGYLTIGIGHKLTKDEIASGKYKNGITLEEARSLAKRDSEREVNRLYSLAPELKDSPAKPVLEDMAFNMGGGFISKWPKLRKQLKDGNYSAASENIMGSKYAKQVKDRAVRNSEYLLNLE